jgi:hypothetical protein
VHGGAAQGEQTVVRQNTISDQLGHADIDRVSVPESIFKLVVLIDPENQGLTDTAITLLSNAWALWLYCKTGKFNVGAKLTDHCAKQFAARYKRRVQGKKVATELDWLKTLKQKSYVLNRKDATVRRVDRRAYSALSHSLTCLISILVRRRTSSAGGWLCSRLR